MEPELKLHSKLAEIMAAIGYIPKDGQAPPAMGNFKFVRIADVADKVRDELAKRHITLLPVGMQPISTSESNGNHFQVWLVTWRFTDGETGETIDVQSIGEGADRFDKGANKVMSAALKYVMLLSFVIPTGDDPEDADHEAPPARRPAAPRPATPNTPSVPEGEVAAFVAAQTGDIRWSLPEIQKRAVGRLPLPELNMQSKTMFGGRTINLLTDDERKTLAESAGLS